MIAIEGTFAGAENGKYLIRAHNPDTLLVFTGRDAHKFVQVDPPEQPSKMIAFDWLVCQLVAAQFIPKEIVVLHSTSTELEAILVYLKRLTRLKRRSPNIG